MRTSKPHWVEKIVENVWDLKRSRCTEHNDNGMPEVADGDKDDEFKSDCEEDNDDLKLQL